MKYLIAVLNSHLSTQAFRCWLVAKHMKNGGRKFKRRQRRRRLWGHYKNDLIGQEEGRKQSEVMKWYNSWIDRAGILFFFFNEKQESHQQYNVIKCSMQLPVQGRACLLVASALTLARGWDLLLMPLTEDSIHSATCCSHAWGSVNDQHVPFSAEIFGEGRDFVKDTAATPSSILRETATGLLTSREDSRF